MVENDSSGEELSMTSDGASPRLHGFTYQPLAAEDAGGDDEPVTYVELRHHEHAGPFWSHDEGLFEDYSDWKSYGMSRETFDACLRWNRTGGHAQEKAQLLSALRQELPASVEVETT